MDRIASREHGPTLGVLGIEGGILGKLIRAGTIRESSLTV